MDTTESPPSSAADDATKSPTHKKPKLIVTEEWDDDPDRFEITKEEEYNVEALLIFKDQATKDQFKKHHQAFFEAQGYEIPIPPPQCYQKTLVEVVPMDDPVLSTLVREGAELALADLKKRTSKNLKLVNVEKANVGRVAWGREFYITFNAKGEGELELPNTYQTRVFRKDYGPDANTVTVQAFRPKPEST